MRLVHLLRAAIAGSFLHIGIPAWSQSASGTNLGEVNGWSLHDGGRGWCTAFGIFNRDVYIRVGYSVGTDTVELYVFDPAWASIRQGAIYEVRVDFSNGSDWPGRAEGVVVPLGSQRATGLGMSFAAGEFLEDFAAAAAMRLRMGNNFLGSFSLRGTRQVVARLITCSGASFRRNPPDPFVEAMPGSASQPGVSRIFPPQRARANLGSYFSMDDYPAEALRNRAEGVTRFTLTIGANGRVADCGITSSSGSAALDEATCRILRSRARYTPARDGSGTPTTGVDRG